MKKLNLFVFSIFIAALIGSFNLPAQQSTQEIVSLQWLDEHPPNQTIGVSWGVPWPRGAVKKGQGFVLKADDGQNLPLQSWPMAYWPDGTVKWSGFSTVAETGSDEFKLSRSAETVNAEADIILSDNKENIKISSGGFSFKIPKKAVYCSIL